MYGYFKELIKLLLLDHSVSMALEQPRKEPGIIKYCS